MMYPWFWRPELIVQKKAPTARVEILKEDCHFYENMDAQKIWSCNSLCGLIITSTFKNLKKACSFETKLN